MKIKLIILYCLLSLSFFTGQAQFTDRYWAFGDSAAIDFKNLNSPVASSSILRVRGTCVSICDSIGDLLFYGGSPNIDIWQAPGPPFIYDMGYLVNKNHQKMNNGDSLKSLLWYQEMIIIPDPGNINRFYVFTAGVTTPTVGFFYNVVDLSLNGGLGKVIQKNVQLKSFKVDDGLAAVKHGNGRDWWIVMKQWENTVAHNTFYFYLVTPSGLSGPFIQSIGTPVIAGFQRFKFSKDGTKLYTTTPDNLIEQYDFDRCTGLLSNAQQLSPVSSTTSKFYWSFAVSPDGSKMYTSCPYQTSNQDTSYLVQYDLNASNFLSSADTLFALPDPYIMGLLQLGPDDKIYLSSFSDTPDCEFDYLYCDTTRNYVTDNISVINSPDSLGTACNFLPFSFNLGGHRAYPGLPNNPNYELDALLGSACDTLNVGLNELVQSNKNELVVYYDTPWQTAFINAKGLKGKNYKLQLFNLNGQVILEESGKLDSEYYTKNAILSSFADGMYIVRLSTEKEVLVAKFVK